MRDELRDTLARQHELAWRLAAYHLDGLGRDECLWRPAASGLHVVETADGGWRGEWPAHEGYDLGPPSIAWLLWHTGFWWSMVLDHSFGDAALDRGAFTFPGRADAARATLESLHAEWVARLERLDDDALRATDRTKWPYADRPFGDVVAWVNVELTKAAAEIGYARFLYAARPTVV